MSEPTKPTRPELTDLHVCMGLNSCKGQDASGTAPMAGMGYCATVQHVCHGDNECRGHGGCGSVGTPTQQGRPGMNACRGYGSCPVPLNKNRVTSEGFHKGKRVWKLARELFEQRMYEIGMPFGPSPGEGYPDDLIWPCEINSARHKEWIRKYHGDPKKKPHYLPYVRTQLYPGEPGYEQQTKMYGPPEADER